jgi:hypothetical protein
MKPFTRRDFMASAGRVVAGGFALTLPRILTDPAIVRAAAARSTQTTQETFVALIEAVTTVPDEKTASWVIAEFDKALPPLPEGSPSAAVATLLDARTVIGAHGATFATADPDARRAVLADMLKDPSADIRQVANQILPFSSFAYWSDATLEKPAKPGGKRLPQWKEIGFPGPSHSYLDSYRDGSPRSFRAHNHGER